MIICLNSLGVPSGSCVKFCYLKMISENIGLFQILGFEKLGLDIDT